MSTPPNEVNAEIAKLRAQVDTAIPSLKARIASLELDAQAFYKRHAIAMLVTAAIVMGCFIWKLV